MVAFCLIAPLGEQSAGTSWAGDAFKTPQQAIETFMCLYLAVSCSLPAASLSLHEAVF